MTEGKELIVIPNVHVLLRKIEEFVKEVHVTTEEENKKREITLGHIGRLRAMHEETASHLTTIYPMYIEFFKCPVGHTPGGLI